MPTMTSARENLEAAFEHALALARGLDLANRSTVEERRLGRAILEMRRHVIGRNGEPDWAGATGEYRSRMQEIYGSISASPSEVQKLKQRLRWFFQQELPRMVDEAAVGTMADAVENMIPMDEDFFEAINVYAAEHGRTAENTSQALQLLIAASRLLGFVQADAIRSEGPQASAVVAQTVYTSIEVQAKALREQLQAE